MLLLWKSDLRKRDSIRENTQSLTRGWNFVKDAMTLGYSIGPSTIEHLLLEVT